MLKIEDLKQEYFRLHEFDSRLPELFDMIPAEVLREYLIKKIKEA